MLNLLRSLGIREFPTTTVAIWIFFGLVAASGICFVFRDAIAGRIHVHFGVVVTGVLAGGFLGCCYHVSVENCWLGLSW
jgi:hypothetical protein